MKNNTESKGYILGSVTLGTELNKKNRELTKILAAANERIMTIANPIIMFNQIILIESKGSSAIENIVTTDDELYKETISELPTESNASKTLRIRSAVKYISKIIDDRKVILLRDLEEMSTTINGNAGGVRPTIGTKLKNTTTGEVVHTPPETKQETIEHLNILLRYVNEGGKNDPITDAILVHHAFEWIHPFADGNGRVGRILMGAFLKLNKETEHIFLPISYFINKKRGVYYSILKGMTNHQDYEEYLKKMYDFFIDAAQYTLDFVRQYDKDRNEVKQMLFDKFNKYHDEKYIDCLFYNAYSTPKTLETHMKLNYRTIKNIMDFLISKKVFDVKKEGKNVFYINKKIARDTNG